MKRFLQRILLLAWLPALLAGCSREPAVSETEVSFSVQVGDLVKAAWDGSSADQLQVQVYDGQGTFLDYIPVTTSRTAAGQFSVKARLVRGVSYTFLFFAGKEGVYPLGQDGVLALPSAMATSDPSADAFYAVTQVVAKEGQALSVTLRRPFALLRFLPTDWDKATERGLTGISSQVVLEHVPDRINLLTGAVSGDARVILEEAPSPSTGEEVAYAFVFAQEAVDYIGVSLSVSAGSFSSVRNLADVPVFRNRQTVLKGDYFTTEGTLDITLDAD